MAPFYVQKMRHPQVRAGKFCKNKVSPPESAQQMGHGMRIFKSGFEQASPRFIAETLRLRRANTALAPGLGSGA